MSDWNRRGLLALGGATIVAGGARAQDSAVGLAPELGDRLGQMMRDAKVPAAGVAVVHEGAVVAAQGLGLASLPFQVPADERTLFHLGSVSKQLTASLVLELVEAGAIALDDPVGRHARGLPEAFATAPIRTLLSHTSGIPDYEGLEGFEADRAIDRETFLAGAAALPLNFRPGEAWAYSNTGYVLLGYLLADVTGQSYRDRMSERLLGRVGLRDARVDEARAIIPGRAEPYVLEDGVAQHAVGMDSDFSGWPDGGVLMSARDAARWEQALQGGSVPSRFTVEGLTTPALMASGRSAAYGAGWFTDRLNGHAVQYHSGSVPGFLTYAWRAPRTRTAVTVMVNIESSPAAAFMREACLMLAESVAPGSTPLSLVPTEDDAPEVTAAALTMLARADRALDPAQFTPEVSALIGGQAGGSVLPPNLGPDLAGVGWALVERHEEPGGQVRRYRLTRGGRMRHISIAYAPDGRIYRVRTL